MSDLSMMAENALHKAHKQNDYMNQGGSLFWFVVVVIIVFLFLALFKPDYVLRERHGERTDEVDWFVVLLSSIVIAIIVCIIIWILAYAFAC